MWPEYFEERFNGWDPDLVIQIWEDIKDVPGSNETTYFDAMLAIAESIEEGLARDPGRRPSHVEGRRTSDWILIDYVDFVVHVFRDDRRQFYRLERLWGDAPVIDPSNPASKTAG